MSILLDVILIGIVIVACMIAYQKGLLVSIFNLISSLLAIALSFIFFPFFSDFLKGTAAFGWIQSPVQTLLAEQAALLSEVSPEGLLAQLPLPEAVFEKMIASLETVAAPELVASTSVAVAGFVLDVLCMIVLFIIVKIGLLFVKGLLEKITSLPVLKQIDKVGGVVFGLLEAFVFLTIVGAVFSLFSGMADGNLLNGVEHSVIAKFFYQENLLLFFLSNKI